jgi:hypothetical protein
MEVLNWIQKWFKDHCDGDWEHGEAIQINTLDNPGWEVEVDISKTSIANIDVERILNENGPQDWYGVKVKDQKIYRCW